MIYEFGPDDHESVDAIPDPKHVWWDIDRLVVFTGDDIPPPSNSGSVA